MKIKETIRTYKDLRVFQKAMDLAMEIYVMTKKFPKEELYSLTDQMWRSSRSVCSNLAESWRKRRYQAAFISKLSDSETEAAETQVWIEIALRCNYIPKDQAAYFEQEYDRVIAQIVTMIEGSENWILRNLSGSPRRPVTASKVE